MHSSQSLHLLYVHGLSAVYKTDNVIPNLLNLYAPPPLPHTLMVNLPDQRRGWIKKGGVYIPGVWGHFESLYPSLTARGEGPLVASPR